MRHRCSRHCLQIHRETQPLNDAEEIRRHLEHQVDLVIDAGACHGQVTTVIDLAGEAPRLVREGSGDIRPFGFVKEALH